jgi:hypothetical protein
MAHCPVDFYACGWRIVISPTIPQDSPPCCHSSMRHLVVLFIHFPSTLVRLLGPGGVRSIVDRILAGGMALLMPPTRLLRFAIVLKPSTLLTFHKAMSKRKYRNLFSPNRLRKPGPKGPSAELIHAIVEMKQRNPMRTYFNNHRAHTSLEGRTPDTPASRPIANLRSFRWQPHCRTLYQTPVAA